MRTIVIAALIAASAPAAAAFEFRNEDCVRLTLPGRIVPSLQFSPDSGETAYQLCAWAQGEYYMPDTRPSPQVRDCINRQAAANGKTVREMNVIHPGVWYATYLTPEEYRNIRTFMAMPVPFREWPEQLQEEHERLDSRVDRVEDRIDGHGVHIGTLEETVDGMVVTADEARGFLENWSIWLALLVIAVIVVLFLGLRPRKRKEAEPAAAQTSPLRTAPVHVQSEPVRFTGTVDVLLPPNMEVEPVNQPDKPAEAGASQPVPPTPASNEHQGVVVPVFDEKTKTTHEISFGSGGKNPDGEELIVSPWTGRTVKHANAASYAEAKYKEKGLPK